MDTEEPKHIIALLDCSTSSTKDYAPLSTVSHQHPSLVKRSGTAQLCLLMFYLAALEVPNLKPEHNKREVPNLSPKRRWSLPGKGQRYPLRLIYLTLHNGYML